MAVILSSNFYTITNHPHLHNHIRRSFQTTTKNSNLYPFHLHHRRFSVSSKPNDYEAEEQRWIREEQRWLREEQRWLREETRWNSERHSLLRQISELSLQIQHLQSELDDFRNNRSNSADYEVTTLTNMAALLEAKNSNQIPDSMSNSEVESTNLDSVSDISSLNSPESETKEETKPLEKAKSSWSTSLRVGCEGEEVRAMQEALMKLGFYSGEEDMEFNYFSTDTERAVKTWQASIGIREDGIMTLELLDQLYAPQQSSSSSSSFSPSPSSAKADIPQGKANGAPTKIKEVQQTVVKKGPADVGISEHRVYLLGENRWEEPSRLIKGNDNLGGGDTTQPSAPKCLSCRGEGRLLCMECDGTGDSQVEEQFLDWIDGGAKCPYCEGLGYTDCDICGGKGAA